MTMLWMYNRLVAPYEQKLINLRTSQSPLSSYSALITVIIKNPQLPQLQKLQNQ